MVVLYNPSEREALCIRELEMSPENQGPVQIKFAALAKEVEDRELTLSTMESHMNTMA